MEDRSSHHRPSPKARSSPSPSLREGEVHYATGGRQLGRKKAKKQPRPSHHAPRSRYLPFLTGKVYRAHCPVATCWRNFFCLPLDTCRCRAAFLRGWRPRKTLRRHKEPFQGHQDVAARSLKNGARHRTGSCGSLPSASDRSDGPLEIGWRPCRPVLLTSKIAKCFTKLSDQRKRANGAPSGSSKLVGGPAALCY